MRIAIVGHGFGSIGVLKDRQIQLIERLKEKFGDEIEVVFVDFNAIEDEKTQRLHDYVIVDELSKMPPTRMFDMTVEDEGRIIKPGKGARKRGKRNPREYWGNK